MRRAASTPMFDALEADGEDVAVDPWCAGDARERASGKGSDESAQTSVGEVGGGAARAGATVLVVDDCALNRRVVTSVLMSTFIEVRVETARDGREGIKRFEELTREGDLALIVMDYHMPWCDGVTAAKYIRALEERQVRLAMENDCAPREKVPIVMYTTELHVILPALVDGVIDDRLPKVCTRDLFSRVVLRQLAPTYIKYVLPEWRGLDARCMRFSCNDAFNVEFDPRGVAFAVPERSAPPVDGMNIERKRMRGGLRSLGLQSLSSKKLKRNDDTDVIMLLDKMANNDASSRGIINRLTRSFRTFFTSTPTMHAKMKEVKRAAMANKFHSGFGSKGDSSATFASLRQPSLPRYSY